MDNQEKDKTEEEVVKEEQTVNDANTSEKAEAEDSKVSESTEEKEKPASEKKAEKKAKEKEPTCEEKLAALEKDYAEIKDQYLRKVADFDNYRKRMLREKQEAFDYANTNLLTDLIAILDDFDRALSAGIDKDGKSLTDLKPVVDGIKMINKQMKGLLDAKYNLSSYGEKGDLFDHDKHEAIASNPGPVAEAVCQEVYLKGYMLKDRVIRPAKVMVTMPDGSVEPKEDKETNDTANDDGTKK